MSDTAAAGTGTEEAPATGAVEESGTETTAPSIETLQAEIADLKAHSRKWEDRAKANKEKADRFDAAERERMTDAERAEADRLSLQEAVEDAQRERDEARADLARYKVATEFGLSAEDAEALSSITDESALRSLAERLSGRASGGPRPNPAQGRASGAPSATPADAFAGALADLF